MELTAMAAWLNTTFAGFDLAVFGMLHGASEAAGWFLTPFFHLVSFCAENGIGLLVVSFVLMLFRSTRKAGMCMFVAVLCGAIITNVLLKHVIVRPRPFSDEAGIVHAWWLSVGAPLETSASFPSGHTTATMAAMTALFLSLRGKARWLCFVPVVLMGLSRIYLMVHYPTDVIGGIAAGALGATGAFLIVRALYRFLESHAEDRWPNFILTFDIRGDRSERPTGP
ncbi:phosphatase PAP2 family protein [Raoultibacter phocaeensis]|uniref:phosphatase PAP2 family protein n=1 Tax=Raoultibacter phocaeensis TaxID=2479841 RepID=UPI0015D5CDE8|nr:phosphatase PAP2 family protein [Raoultibacter phocaeensis]